MHDGREHRHAADAAKREWSEETGHEFPDGKQTGTWFHELAAPYYILTQAGFEVVFASPEGGEERQAFLSAMRLRGPLKVEPADNAAAEQQASTAATDKPVTYADLQAAVLKLHKLDATAAVPIAVAMGFPNFKAMPELEWAHGYPMALGLMLVSAVAPLVYFRRRGWLK